MKVASYPKIYNVGHRALEGLFGSEVIIQEKVDGSQFSFGRVFDGELGIRSKGQQIDLDNPPKMFAAAVEYVKLLEPDLLKDVTYRCEWLNKPKHNSLAYERTPFNGLMLFDIERPGQYYEQDRLTFELEAESLGIEPVPELFRGMVNNIDELRAFFDRDSILGNVKIEGMVIKNYVLFTPDKTIALGKWVSEAFKETHQKDWKNRNPNTKDIVFNLTEELRTEARWAKAVQHLNERDELDHSPKDIGALLREIQTDVLAEEGERIKEVLFKHFWKLIARGITTRFPEWYKDQLAEAAFDSGPCEECNDTLDADPGWVCSACGYIMREIREARGDDEELTQRASVCPVEDCTHRLCGPRP